MNGHGKVLLAGTRPVFRGLRRKSFRKDLGPFLRMACKDETRFQGIATRRRIWPPRRSAWPAPACKDETHFQGIATSRDGPGLHERIHPLAGTRPVFRGWQRREGAGGEADRVGGIGGGAGGTSGGPGSGACRLRLRPPRAPGKKERGARRLAPRSSSAPAEPGLPSGARRKL
jgi:hypothetical protein